MADDRAAWERQERTRKALGMRLAGAEFREIAEVLGVSATTVHSDVHRALAEIPAGEADELRRLEVSRLDRLQRAVWTTALGGDLGAVDRALRIIDRRAKLLGLDAPQRMEVSGGDIDLDSTVARILEAAQMAAGRQEDPADA